MAVAAARTRSNGASEVSHDVRGAPRVELRAPQWRDWPPLLAESGDVTVGFISVGASRDADADGELFAIYVDPDYWGSGVGRKLMAAGEERLRELGHVEAILWVLADNPRVLASTNNPVGITTGRLE